MGDVDQEKYLKDAFPNVEALLRAYLTLLLRNYSGEGFSELKLITDEHQSTVNQSRLVRLTMLSMEWGATD